MTNVGARRTSAITRAAMSGIPGPAARTGRIATDTPLARTAATTPLIWRTDSASVGGSTAISVVPTSPLACTHSAALISWVALSTRASVRRGHVATTAEARRSLRWMGSSLS